MTVISKLQSVLTKERVLAGQDLNAKYNHIWRMDDGLKALAFVSPETTMEVSEILKICHETETPVVVFGGLTNLVGSTETTGDEVVLSMERMNNIEEVDIHSRTLTVQAGVILENVQNAAMESGLLFPMNFGAKGSAQIGGAISTNAGGLRVLKFGMMRNLILGLEAVLADGTVVSSMKKIIKDNSGYDVKQLFIGSEGTLGVVTRAVLRLVEAPTSRQTAMMAVDSYGAVLNLLKYMDAGLGGSMSGFELMWDNFYTIATSPPSQMRPPIPHGHRYYILVESLGTNTVSDKARMQDLLEKAFEENRVADAVMADGDSDLAWFWKIREDVHVIASQTKFNQHFDISLPVDKIGDVIDATLEKLLQLPEVEFATAFGHVADGNIHLIVAKTDASKETKRAIDEVVYMPLSDIGGSVSAEHGIGLHKKMYLSYCRSPEEIQLMKTLKKSLDEKGILNPGKVLDLD